MDYNPIHVYCYHFSSKAKTGSDKQKIWTSLTCWFPKTVWFQKYGEQ